jgi:hypothetical protein
MRTVTRRKTGWVELPTVLKSAYQLFLMKAMQGKKFQDLSAEQKKVYEEMAAQKKPQAKK